jgi:hypothetical protein
VLLLIIALAIVIPVGVVVLVGGVKLLPLGAVGDEVGGVAALEAASRWYPPPLWNLCKAQNFLASRAISPSGMLSYCSSETTSKEDRALQSRWDSGVDGVSIMATNMSTSKRSIMVRTIFPRQFIRFKLAK